MAKKLLIFCSLIFIISGTIAIRGYLSIPTKNLTPNVGTPIFIPVGELSAATKIFYQSESAKLDITNEFNSPKNAVIISASRLAAGSLWTIEKPIEIQGDEVSITQFLKNMMKIPVLGPPVQHEFVVKSIRETPPALIIKFAIPDLMSDDEAINSATGTNPKSKEIESEGFNGKNIEHLIEIKFTIFDGRSDIVYASISTSDGIYAVSGDTLFRLRHNEDDFFNKSLVQINSFTIRNLTFKGFNREPIDFVHSQSGFEMIRPSRTWVPPESIQKIIAELQAIQTTDAIVNPNDSLVNLFKTPTYTIVWESSSGAATTLNVTETPEEVYAAFRSHRVIFTVPRTITERLRVSLSSFLKP